MQHCCSFRPDETYFLSDNELCSKRKLSIGICPICSKPVAEMVQTRFDGKFEMFHVTGIKANSFVQKFRNRPYSP